MAFENLHHVSEEDKEYLDGAFKVYIRVYTGPLGTAEADSPVRGTLMPDVTNPLGPRLMVDRIEQGKDGRSGLHARHVMEFREYRLQ